MGFLPHTWKEGLASKCHAIKHLSPANSFVILIRTTHQVFKIQHIHVKNQYREVVTDAGLAAEHHAGATTDFELLPDNLVMPFFGQICLNRDWRQMQTAPLSKILASGILQALNMKHIRVG